MREFFIKEIENKDLWEGFLSNIKEKTFLQSWNWGEFQKMLGNKIWRFGICNENNELLGVALILEIKAKRGAFLFCPHGPVVKVQSSSSPAFVQEFKAQSLETLLEKLKEVAREEKCSFIRFSPIWERNEENKKIFEDLGFRKAPIHMHPELTWVLDITLSEEELLRRMRKTTRYLIRQGMKEESLKIIKSKDIEDVEIFNQVYKETAARHHFVPFSLDYLKKEFSAFSKDGESLIFLAKYKEDYIASAMIIFWQGIAFYHQGASVQKYSKVPSAYLLQWEAIKEAKRRNCRIYNFWGIAPEESGKKHPWWGLSLFKKGFGGYKKEYVKTQDLSLSSKYWLTFIIETIRRKKRRL